MINNARLLIKRNTFQVTDIVAEMTLLWYFCACDCWDCCERTLPNDEAMDSCWGCDCLFACFFCDCGWTLEVVCLHCDCLGTRVTVIRVARWGCGMIGTRSCSGVGVSIEDESVCCVCWSGSGGGVSSQILVSSAEGDSTSRPT